jgi:predicted methyltransferase
MLLRNLTIPLAALAALAVVAAPVRAAEKIPAFVAKAVADPGRPDADKARDAARKPAETIAFAGVKQGDKVGELLIGGGYFTRILAKAVGPKGHVYAINPSASKAADALAADPAYGNISAVATALADLKVDEPLDLVWTSQNYHDLHNRPGSDMLPINKAIFAALKPGGTYLVLDHVAAAGTSADQMRTLHRIDPAIVKSEVLAAGFVLAGESDLLHNTTDDHTGASHADLHDKTDQFILKFRKPK